MTVTSSFGKRRRRNREWVLPENLWAVSTCYHILHESLRLTSRLHPINFSPAKWLSLIHEQTPLCLSLFWGCCSSLFCFQGWPKSQISQLSPLIPLAHTAFLLSDLTISSVTSNLEPNYILGCVVLWLLPLLNLVPQSNCKVLRIRFLTHIYLLNPPHFLFPPVPIGVLSP